MQHRTPATGPALRSSLPAGSASKRSAPTSSIVRPRRPGRCNTGVARRGCRHDARHLQRRRRTDPHSPRSARRSARVGAGPVLARLPLELGRTRAPHQARSRLSVPGPARQHREREGPRRTSQRVPAGRRRGGHQCLPSHAHLGARACARRHPDHRGLSLRKPPRLRSRGRSRARS